MTARSLLALFAIAAVTPVSAQNPDPGMVAGSSGSRFIPHEVFLRMLERSSDLNDAVTLEGTLDGVWPALRSTLEELGVPIGFDDPKNGEIGTQRAKLYRRLGKERLSSYLRCGSGMTGPNADTYAVYLSLVVMARNLGEGKVGLQPLITAQAVDLAGGRNDAVMCTTTGRLERRIGNDLKLKLLKAGS